MSAGADDRAFTGRRATHRSLVTPMEFLTELDAPAWIADGLCSQTDPELFFPAKGGSVREPKSICARCDVRTDCLAYALEHSEQFGIWGGLTERERRKLRRQSTPATICGLDGCDQPLSQPKRGRRLFCSTDHANQARKQVAS